jgi:hypothetical protein
MARLPSARTLVVGGLAVAGAAAAALKNRRQAGNLLGAGSSVPEPYPAPAEAPAGTQAAEPGPSAAPAVSNFDAAGPPSNTSTHVPAPEPFVHDPSGGIDEEAEEAAAAAEAANIGGAVGDYPGLELGETADEAIAPLIEAGEGESEGQELAEFELADNAEPAAGDPLEGGRQIDDVIEAQDDPSSGEVPFDDNSSHGNPPAEAEQSVSGATPGSEPDAPAPGPGTPGPDTGATLAAGTIDDGAATTGGSLSGLAGSPSTETSAAEKSANVWQGEDAAAEQPTVEQPKATDTPEDDDGSEWQTWSGRAVEP